MAAKTDLDTASAFATSWNTLPAGSVYTTEQFEDWLSPIRREDAEGRSILELGCGNGSLLLHCIRWHPSRLVGVDLGASVLSARQNLAETGAEGWEIIQADLTAFESGGFDVVYCIGVLHHLQDPQAGFDAVVRNTKPGGRFHCWVYAREGNTLVVLLVDPLRKVASKLHWWFTKYFIASPLAAIFYLYAKAVRLLRRVPGVAHLPLYAYSLWIAAREYAFFRHVAFDQLVTPATVYLSKTTIQSWLAAHPRVNQEQSYVIMRNGNSWKFGGVVD
ncbi:MAG: class I SAM-dependent methyltransferase [Chthoniobacterales bacterium]